MKIYILLGTVLGATITAAVSYVSARLTMKGKREISLINAEKEIDLQTDRLVDARTREEVALEREELKKLHMILSRVSLENSITMSHMQSDNGMEILEFRERYLENCYRLHEARAISDIYYPEMSEKVLEIYGQSNIFWGYQEGVLRAGIEENREVWQSNLSKVLRAGETISECTRNLQNMISRRGEKLKKGFINLKDDF